MRAVSASALVSTLIATLPRRSCAGPRQAQRVRDQLLGVLALGVEQQPVDFARREAQLDQPGSREAAPTILELVVWRASRAAARRDHRLIEIIALAAHHDLLSQLHDDPLRRSLADARH